MKTIIAACLLLLAACDDNPAQNNSPAIHTILLEVIGNCRTVDISYDIGDVRVMWVHGTDLPWTFTCEKPKGTLISLAAQSQDSTGMITVNMYRDAILWKTSSNSGPYVTAAVQGIL